mmetsp:Transcript_892/g.2233  ORF Transcript_892/g.2233 Transcript_892/m.2233 type:complete len:205 (-) Transcript_892:790-1404(-)
MRQFAWSHVSSQQAGLSTQLQPFSLETPRPLQADCSGVQAIFGGQEPCWHAARAQSLTCGRGCSPGTCGPRDLVACCGPSCPGPGPASCSAGSPASVGCVHLPCPSCEGWVCSFQGRCGCEGDGCPSVHCSIGRCSSPRCPNPRPCDRRCLQSDPRACRHPKRCGSGSGRFSSSSPCSSRRHSCTSPLASRAPSHQSSAGCWGC